jgi:phosphodiesterase/alkaline phosphatase D-like protein
VIYPGNDTLTLKTPLSEVLTGCTAERRDDILGPSGVILTDGTVASMPSFGSIVDAGTFSYDPLWLWSGGINGDSAVLAAKVAINSPAVRFAVSRYGTIGDDAIYSDVLEATDANANTVKSKVEGLEPNTGYYYAVEMGGSLASGFVGQFTTFNEDTLNFSFALSSCSRNTVTAAVNPTLFDTIRTKNPLFFLHMGDMHYNDGGDEPNSILNYHRCWDRVFELSSRQRAFWQHVPVEYIWDDHDYGPNNSAGNWEFKKFAREAFQETVPSYPLAPGTGNTALYRTFSVGRCFFIVLDTRSEASPVSATDGPDKTRLGAAQKAWFKQQLLFGAAHYAFTFVVTPTTWGGAASPGDDTWAGYATERQEICDFIATNNLSGIALLSGDMHACAFDDGTNNAFGTGGTGGMAILQAAPIDNSASQKGTPYTDGPYPSSGTSNRKQYGMVTVWDNGTGTPYITFEAFNDTTGTDTQLFSHSFYGTESPA